MEPVGRQLSDALSEPLIKAYRIGGFGLAFLILGAIFLAASVATPRGPLSYLIALVGFLLILIPCYFFYVKEIRPIASAKKGVQQNAELVNSVQEAGVKMTLAAKDIQAIALRYAGEFAELMGTVRPQLSRIPPLRRLLERSHFETAERFTQQVVVATGNLERESTVFSMR
jgi:hypothetical protein